jgi:hypothetical protein
MVGIDRHAAPRAAGVLAGTLALAFHAGCSDSGSEDRGAEATGGALASGAGGLAGASPIAFPGAGGVANVGTGGLLQTGGFPGTAGAPAAGGSEAFGGAPGAGGDPPAGGIGGLPAGGEPGVGGVPGAGGEPPGTGGSVSNPDDFCLQPGSGDYAQNGPYAVATEDVTIGASGMYTIWYPRTLEENCRHPIVAWGNGTTVTGSAVYAFFNNAAASFGMVAIGSHNSNVGSGDFHRAAIDYLLAQNEDPGSKFYQKLSPRVGVSGHSQGGAGASRAASHPNVQALVPVGFSGTALPGQAFLCLTGTADIASVPGACRSAVQRAPGPAMVAIWEGGDHVVTETLAGWLARDPGTIQMTRLYAAWFRCFLADDPVACGLFTGGSQCDICDDPGWAEVVTNNL